MTEPSVKKPQGEFEIGFSIFGTFVDGKPVIKGSSGVGHIHYRPSFATRLGMALRFLIWGGC